MNAAQVRTRDVHAVLVGIWMSAAAQIGTAHAEQALVEQRASEDAPLRTVRLEEIVVTGSRLKIGPDEGPSPVTVFDEQKIKELGVSTVSEILNFLPQQAYAHDEIYRRHGAQFVQLRGLGVDTTLVLINGRRTVPSAASVSSNAFDLNTIPLAAVERVEILSDSASAVYGADAVGGVVNIILKKGVTGTVIDARYGGAQGGAEEQRLSLSAGHSTERSGISLVLDYFRRDHLLGIERESGRDQDFTRFGGMDARSLNAHPGNISSSNGADLPGLSSSYAAVPEDAPRTPLTPNGFSTPQAIATTKAWRSTHLLCRTRSATARPYSPSSICLSGSRRSRKACTPIGAATISQVRHLSLARSSRLATRTIHSVWM